MAGSWEYGYRWKPYVSVAKRRAQAQQHARKLTKQGHEVRPVVLEGRKIAGTFWGKAWCDNLESYSDFENRLPRGRTYVRNGSVIDLQMVEGQVTAIVSGSELYDVTIAIKRLGKKKWNTIKQDCSQSIDSLIDLLQGRFSQGVMERLTRPKDGLFPQPSEINIQCSCPDWAGLCKHAAAALYGVGARLDTDPELLFQLREVDHLELISQATDSANLDAAFAASPADSLEGADLSELFGIELDAETSTGATATAAPKKTRRRRSSSATTSKKKPAARKATASASGKSARTARDDNGTKSTVQATKRAKKSPKKKTATKKTATKKTAPKKKASKAQRSTKTKSTKKAAVKRQTTSSPTPTKSARKPRKKK